ncbi:MAG: DUF4012 domain-containing protein, partial [Chloroflexota bacterium]
AALLGWHARSALGHLVEVRRSIPQEGAAQSGRPRPDVAGVRASLQGLSDELGAVRWHAAPFLLLAPNLRWLPVVGGDAAAAPYLLDLGRNLAGAGVTLLDGLAPVLEMERHQGDPPAAAGLSPAALSALTRAGPQLAAADGQLAQAEAAWARIQGERLTPGLAGQLEPVGRYLPVLRAGVQLATVAPELLGAEGARSYLIIAQNEDELRPTGGYMSAAGLVTVERGQITQLRFDDSYAVDDLSKPYPDPPEALRRFMLADLWLFRDVNWSPDFPTTARIAADYYAYGRGVQVDGVVAVDQAALQYLLEGLGAVTIEATGETVSADTVIEAIRAHWAPAVYQGPTGEWWEQRKSFMGDLAAAIQHKVEAEPGSLDVMALARAAARALVERHILIYPLAPPRTESGPRDLARAGDDRSPLLQVAEVLRRAGWDGAIRSSAGDYLMVVDANVGFNKASAATSKRIDYHVTLDAEGGGRAQAAVETRHNGTPAEWPCRPEVRYDPAYAQHIERCLWNYARLYVPRGAVLEAGPRVVVPAEAMLSGEPTTGAVEVELAEGDRTFFGQLFLLPPGETIVMEYDYRLPVGLAQPLDSPGKWRYDLVLQKQPGAGATAVSVLVSLPEGGSVLTSWPRPAEGVTGGDIAYRFDLSEDHQVSLTYEIGARP